MSILSKKRILVGISGGIAAYKIPDLVRRLREQGAEVRVAMTTHAQQFITPLTLQAVSGQRVHTDLFDLEAEAAMGHIQLARWAEVVLIAPATANLIAKLANGLADDLLSTVCLATAAPLVVAPAMNQQMWAASATQENCQRLTQRGIQLFGPAVGSQACGEIGAGRMLEPLQLLAHLESLFHNQTPGRLQGRRVLITAGPTREDIDPVRFISNRSSGKMGFAVASAAKAAGAEVILVSGPVALMPPPGVELIAVYSAQEMFEAVMARITTIDIFIASAAVADYRPTQQAVQKIKKRKADLVLTLERTPDILASVAGLPKPPFTVGFAAETQDVVEYARDKLLRKKLDMIAANQVGTEGIGFDSQENALTVIWSEGSVELPRCSKQQLAVQLLDIVADRYQT